MTMFEAFETPIGTRESDRTWRGMVARARREYLTRLMPVWAAVLTLATLVLGLPGLYLLGAATGFSENPSILVILDQGPLASSLAVLSRWVAPLVSVLSPTDQRFGLEAFVIGMVLMLALALLVRAAGSRQWYQSVYDDIPRRRWLLSGLLWIALPLIVCFLMLFFGALIVEVESSPAIVSVLIALIAVVVLCAALSVVYLTFSVREPAIPSVIVGAASAAVLLCLAAVVVEWVPGVRTLPPGETSPFRALVSLSVLLFVFWALVLAGSQLSVAMARRRDPIERFNHANRGEQLDFALSLIRVLERQTQSQRWARTDKLAMALAAPTAMVTYALDRLRRSGIVAYDDDGSRPPNHWAIKNDLEALTLHDLSRAMGTNLDPLPGLHGRTHEDVIADLAEREHLSQTQDLLSLFRDQNDLIPVGEPMLAVTEVDYRLGDEEAFAASQAFEPTAQVVDRDAGDNGGPTPGEPSYVFVESQVEEGMVLNLKSGPSALLDPDQAGDAGLGEAAIALDLTTTMRIVPDDTKEDSDEGTSEDSDEETPEDSGRETTVDDGPLVVSTLAEGNLDEDVIDYREPAPLALGPDSPLASVRAEIDNLLSDGSAPISVVAVSPLSAWRRSAAAAKAAAAARARLKRAFAPAGAALSVDAAGSWKRAAIPARDPAFDAMVDPVLDPVVSAASSSAPSTPDEPQDTPDSAHETHREWLLPVPPKRSWRQESGALDPVAAWKRDAG